MEYAMEMIWQDYLRHQQMMVAMEAEVSQLPKGSLTYRAIKGKRYCYLQHRDENGHVCNRIVHEQEIEKTQILLERRRFLERNIKIYVKYLKWIEKGYPQFKSIMEFLEVKDEQKIYRTLKGEFVRSKSEVIIANLLYANQIPYEYEKPLKLSGYPHPISPDFTIYPPQGDRVVYWEHCGLMHDEQYREHWRWKKGLYESDGISEWQKNLIVTYEQEAGDLNVGEIKQRIEEVLLMACGKRLTTNMGKS